MQTHRINLHDTYGVEWTDEMIARDLVQNFYDSVSAEKFATQIKIEVDRSSKTVSIRGPAEFHIDYLWKIGVTTKQGRQAEFAGEFGEGFVVAILQILRDSNAEVVTRVGKQQAGFRLENVHVGSQSVQELVCDVGPIKPIAGSELLLRNARPSLLHAFEECRTYFRYPENPLFGDKLGEDRTKGIYVYRSTRSTGAILYRRQRRGAYILPYVFCHDMELKEIKTGRDRLNITRSETNALVAKTVSVLAADVIQTLVLRDLEPYWENGHVLLKALSDAWSHKAHGHTLQFPEEYCARYRYGNSWQYDQTARRLDKKICPEYMSRFGMMTTKELDESIAKGQTREPEGVETARFAVLCDAFERVMGLPLAGWKMKVFIPTEKKKAIEGAYGGKTIYLTPERLGGTFSEAFAVFLHEALHSSGADSDPRFADKLTWAINQVVESRSVIDGFESEWGTCTKGGKRKRRSKHDLDGSVALHERLEKLEARLEIVERRVS